MHYFIEWWKTRELHTKFMLVGFATVVVLLGLLWGLTGITIGAIVAGPVVGIIGFIWMEE